MKMYMLSPEQSQDDSRKEKDLGAGNEAQNGLLVGLHLGHEITYELARCWASRLYMYLQAHVKSQALPTQATNTWLRQTLYHRFPTHCPQINCCPARDIN